MIKYIITYVLFVTSFLTAGEVGGLDIIPYIAIDPHMDREGRARGTGPIRVFVTFINRSPRPMTVLTALRDPSLMGPAGSRSMPGETTIRCRVKREIWVNDLLIVPSVVDVRPVVLEPGEAAGATIAIDLPVGTKLADMDLIYSVEAELGRKFGSWSGTITARLRQQKLGERTAGAVVPP